MTRRRAPNLSEMLASALLTIKIGDEWLIDDEYLREQGTPKEIRAYVDFDHIRRHAEDGGMEPQNLQPMRRPEHREKSRIDTTEVAKGKRYGKNHEEFRQRLLAKIGQGLAEKDSENKPKRKHNWPSGRKIQSAGFRKKEKTK